jgi:hypothetical protein
VIGSIGEICGRAAVGPGRASRSLQECQKRKEIAKQGSSIEASHRSTSFSVILRQFWGHLRGVPLAGAAQIAAIKAVSRRLVMEPQRARRCHYQQACQEPSDVIAGYAAAAVWG